MSNGRRAKKGAHKQSGPDNKRVKHPPASPGSQMSDKLPVNGFNLDELPDHSTAQRLRQATILQMQQRQGNRYLQRMLAQPDQDTATSLQRAKKEAKPAAGAMLQIRQENDRAAPVSHQGETPGRERLVQPGDNRSDLAEEKAGWIQRATNKDSDGDDYVELTIPDGTYVLEAANIPAKADWELTYTNFVDVYATAGQYEPKNISGLDADPHTLRHTDKGIDTDRTFRIKPGKALEPVAGQGSAKTQAFRHGYFSNERVLEAYLRFDTTPLLEKTGETEFVAGNIIDMDPTHHDYLKMTEGSQIGKALTSSVTVSDGIAFSASKTVSTTIGSEITQQLGAEIGIEGLGKLSASQGLKTSLKTSVSKTVGTTLTKQIQESKEISASFQFDEPGEYAIVPTCKVWKTPVLINTFDETGKAVDTEKGFLYTVIYNETGSTVKAPGGKVSKHVLDMSPEEFEQDPEAQKELFAMAKGWRDRQQSFAENLLKENEIEGGEVKSILKRDDFDEFVKGIIEKCKRNGYIRIGEMDDIVRGRFNLRSEADVNKIAATMKDQSDYPIKEIVAPRRPQEDGGYGYPRWHIILRDPETRLTHEWQIGTKAATEVFEKAGIDVPDDMKSDVEAGKIKNDLHDIEYDIFAGIKKKYPETHKRYNLPAFHAKVDKVAAEAGRKGDETPELQEKIDELHEEAAVHLQDLNDEFGIEWLRQFYH